MSIHVRRMPKNPALIAHAEERATSVQNRVADQITSFAGSMSFVYIHMCGSRCGSASASRSTRSACSR